MAEKGVIERFKEKISKAWEYCSTGVWSDTRRKWSVNLIKTVNLTIRTFFNSDMQTRACSMTYQMMLAVVPALALIVAIGRGFGLQDLMEQELYKVFPAQHTAVNYAMNFVDSYLNASTEGVFVGVGILFLLYTLISLFSSIEDTFNLIWCVKEGRSLGRKITDYTAMLLILPVVMVCAGGLSIMLTSTLQTLFDWSFMTPIIQWLLEALSWLLTMLFFTLLYMLMPNTKVKFSNAFVAGIFAGIGFLVLQWLFVSGQIYVAKYNAIYGSFSFLPLMLLWMQFTWIIIFTGGIICYSTQNISRYNFNDSIRNMSSSYYARLTLAISAVVVQRFVNGKGATQISYFSTNYSIPPRLTSLICDRLVGAGIFSIVEIDSKHEIKGYQPALDPSQLTVKLVYSRLDHIGSSQFIPGFSENFHGVEDVCNEIYDNEQKLTDKLLISNIKVNIPS